MSAAAPQSQPQGLSKGMSPRLLIVGAVFAVLALDWAAPGQWKFKWINDANPIVQLKFDNPTPPGQSP
jgi:hypothetical protein